MMVYYEVSMWFVQWICLSIVLELIDGIYGYVIGAMDMYDVSYWNHLNNGIKEDMRQSCPGFYGSY